MFLFVILYLSSGPTISLPGPTEKGRGWGCAMIARRVTRKSKHASSTTNPSPKASQAGFSHQTNLPKSGKFLLLPSSSVVSAPSREIDGQSGRRSETQIAGFGELKVLWMDQH